MDAVGRVPRSVRQMNASRPILSTAALLLLISPVQAAPQSAPPAFSKLSTKQELRRQKALRVEMINPYRRWFSFEVRDIITFEEISAFKRFLTDDEREEFIEQFWERRNPEPGSLENKYKQTYFRRAASANERFSSTTPGWQSDRGRIYTKFGPPNEIEKCPHGGMMRWSERPNDVTTVTKPFERWLYRDMAGIGPNRVLIFMDSMSTGDYRLVMLPSDENSILRDSRRDGEMPKGPIVPPESFLKPLHPPAPAKFPDLRAIVNTGKVLANPIPILVRSYAFSATFETDVALVAVQIPTQDLQFQINGGVMRARVNVYGEIQSLGGHIVDAFEKTLSIEPSAKGSNHVENDKFVFDHIVPLRPGRYRLSLALKDESGERTGMKMAELIVPMLGGDRLAATPLILADSVEPYIPPVNELDPFVIGDTKVLPNPGQVFSIGSTLGVYLQVYGLSLDADSHKPNFQVQYDILKDGTPVIQESEDAARLAEASTQFTIAGNIPLKELQPGPYTLQINIADNIGKQTITPTANFSIR
jgi:GWxTD domain-containing protein